MMHILYKTTGQHSSFPEYLEHKLGVSLPDGFVGLADRFTHMTPWWSQIGRILTPYVLNNDLAGAQARFARTFSLLDDLDCFGLDIWCKTAQLSRAWSNLPEGSRKMLGKQCELGSLAFKLIEGIARELLMHDAEQSPVTKHTRSLLREHEHNMINSRVRSLRRAGCSEKGAWSRVRQDAHREGRRAAEREHRLHSLVDYYLHDCGYCPVGFVLEPGLEQSPGHGQELSAAWISAGCPNPRDTHDHMMKRWQRLIDFCRKHGIIVHGYRSAEAFKSGTPHGNGIAFLESRSDAEFFKAHLRRIFAPAPSLGQYDQRVRVFDCWNAQGWAFYVDKNLPQSATAAKTRPRVFDTSPDTDWCKIWGMDQYSFFGQQEGSVGNWRLLQRLDRRQLDDPEYRARLPKPVLDAWLASIGSVIAGGRVIDAKRNYRAFLRLTEPTTPTTFSRAPGGALMQSQPLRFDKRQQPDGGALIYIIDHSSPEVNMIIPLPKPRPAGAVGFLTGDDEHSMLELCVSLPTDQIEPRPKRPRGRPKGPARFSLRLRSNQSKSI